MREMKDSGVEWIGEIPSHWDVSRAKNSFVQKSERGNDKSLVLLSPTQNYGVIPQDLYEELSGFRAVKLNLGTDFSTLKTVHKGAFVISLRSFQGGFEYSEYEGVVSPAYQVFYPNAPVCDHYFKHLFKSQAFIDKMNSFTLSLRDGKNIAFADFARTYIPIPPLDEQFRIAAVLNQKCGQVNDLIDNVQTQIDKLKTYKQSLITEVVTKGLDPTVPMKDSGVEWIGKIPETWNTIRVKQLLKERKERSVDGSEEPLSMSQKLGLVPTRMMDMVPNMASSFVGAKLAYIDDLVFNKLKAHLGVFSVSKYDGLVSPDYAVYYSTGKVHLKYLEYLFKTPQCISEFRKRSTGIAAGLTRLYTDGLFAIECPFPNMDEQVAIVDYLNKKCSYIDQLMTIKQAKIEKLEQYKRSLIYEYVTGKKEVPAHT